MKIKDKLKEYDKRFNKLDFGYYLIGSLKCVWYWIVTIIVISYMAENDKFNGSWNQILSIVGIAIIGLVLSIYEKITHYRYKTNDNFQNKWVESLKFWRKTE